MSNTYSIPEPEPRGSDWAGPPALQHSGIASKSLRDDSAWRSRQKMTPAEKNFAWAETYRRLQIADLFTGLLLLLIAAEIGFQLAEAGGWLNGTAAKIGSWQHWLQSQRQATDWESVVGFAGITARDFLLSGFFFAMGMQLTASQYLRIKTRSSWQKLQFTMLVQIVLLLLAGLLLQSTEVDHIRWVCTHPLIQIGLVLLLAIWLTPAPTWLLSLLTVIILVGHTGWYWTGELPVYSHEQAAVAFEQADEPDIQDRRFARWQRGQNSGDYSDRLWLSQLPNQPDARYRLEGRNTWNLFPGLALMFIGTIALRPLRARSCQPWLYGLVCLLAGSILIFSGYIVHRLYCPAIEKLMTASWVILSGGYALTFLGACVFLVQVLPLERFSEPINRVGAYAFPMYLLTVTCLGLFCQQLIKLTQSLWQLTGWPLLGEDYRAIATTLLPMFVLLLAAHLWHARQRQS